MEALSELLSVTRVSREVVRVNAIIRRLRARSHARRYISGQLSVTDFFRELDSRGANYVVLRWYEDLPDVDPGEDIDILIADEDLPKVAPLLDGRKSKHQPVDLYSETGLDRTSFKNLPYYTPEIAKGILDRAVNWNGICRVPSPQDAFLSMAYHVVYHKGLAANVPARRGEQRASRDYNDHDYVTILAEKAAVAGIPLGSDDVNLEYLDDYLGRVGWRPPMDTLTKLAAHNVWLRGVLFAEDEGLAEHLAGLACFIIRERGVYLLPRIRETLERYGFDCLWETSLGNADGEVARSQIRGGVWSRGPWAVNGGEPSHLIVAYDVFPISPSDKELAGHPGLNNQRILEVKEVIRNLYNRNRQPEDRCNIVHSSDNGSQALDYLRFSAPDMEEFIKIKAHDIYIEHKSPFPILAELGGYSKRSKIYLIEYRDQTAVLKLFRIGRERFLEREIVARELGKTIPYMSEILEAGENYLVLKRYQKSDDLFWMRVPWINRFGYIKPYYLKAIREILLNFRKSGYDWIDLRPNNLILDQKEGLKALDFEYLQVSPGKRNCLDGSLALFPPGKDFTGDLPINFGVLVLNPYENLLRPRFGVSVELFSKDTPEWRLALSQAVSLARKTVSWTVARLRAWLRMSRVRSRLRSLARRVVD